MPIIPVNDNCRIHTNEHSRAYQRNDGTASPQITVGRFRLRLDLHDARTLVADLSAAIAKVEELHLEDRQPL